MNFVNFLKNRERQGEALISAEAVLWSLFPLVTALTLKSMAPLVSLAWSVLFAALFFAVCLTVRKKWAEVFDRSAIGDILRVTFFIGILHYGFVFTGLQYTSPGNAAIISLTEIVWSFLFFNVWKKEHMAMTEIFGAFLMLAGACIILLPGFTEGFNKGDILITLGMAAGPPGNYFQQRAREKVGSETIMFTRSIVAAPFLFFCAFLFGQDLSISPANYQLIILILNGFLLLGLSKILWLEAITRISVVKALSLASASPLLTLIFGYFLFSETPTAFQVISFIPMIFGVILLTREKPGPKSPEKL
jgi:drug/metabolite transporter (DMT)-like permease